MTGREELLFEIVQSVAAWLGDVWLVCFEHGVEYVRACSCLVFSLGVLDHLQNVRGMCVLFLVIIVEAFHLFLDP